MNKIYKYITVVIFTLNLIDAIWLFIPGHAFDAAFYLLFLFIIDIAYAGILLLKGNFKIGLIIFFLPFIIFGLGVLTGVN